MPSKPMTKKEMEEQMKSGKKMPMKPMPMKGGKKGC